MSNNNKVQNTQNNKEALPFGKSNYTLLIIGIVIMLVGFFVMTLDKEAFGFGSLGITVGPIIVFVGFMFQFYTIFKKK